MPEVNHIPVYDMRTQQKGHIKKDLQEGGNTCTSKKKGRVHIIPRKCVRRDFRSHPRQDPSSSPSTRPVCRRCQAHPRPARRNQGGIEHETRTAVNISAVARRGLI